MATDTNKKPFLPLARRTRRWIIRSIALLVLVFAVTERYGCLSQFPQEDRQRYHQRSFTVTRVVDGDTIVLDIPDPHTNRDTTRIRLWGVDTPETVHPHLPVMHFGPEACDFVRALVEGKEVTIILEPHQSTRDIYDRLLVYVYLPDNRMLNELLLSQGYAYAEERFEHVLLDRFIQLQSEAQNQQRGLWREAQPTDWPQWYQQRHAPDSQN